MNNTERIYNIIQNKNRYLLCKELFMDIATLPYAIIKGEPLSYLCYDGYGYRNSSDIDILVPKKHVQTLENILIKNGFFCLSKANSPTAQRKEHIFCLSASHQTVPYIKKGKNHYAEIDINFDIYWGEFSDARMDMHTFLSDTIDINIYGVIVKTLPPLKAFLQLCLHHYKEMNSLYHLSSHQCINTNMFKEVFFFLKNNSDISPEMLYTISNTYHISTYVFYILYYTYQVFPDEFLKKYVDCLFSKDGSELLDKYGLSESEQKKWHCSFAKRLNNPNLLKLIEKDLTEADLKKIRINKQIFK